MTELRKIPLKDIYPSPYQMRGTMDATALEQLSESLKRDGQQRPVKVHPYPSGLPGYELVFGHRTVEAAKLAGWTDIDAVIDELTDEQVMWAQYAENEYREEVSAYDRARWLRNMTEKFGYTQLRVAEKIGKSPGWVSQHLAMLKLEGKFTHVNFLAKMTEPLAREILKAPAELLSDVCAEVEDYYNRTKVMIPTYDIPDLINYVIATKAHPESPSEELEEGAEEDEVKLVVDQIVENCKFWSSNICKRDTLEKYCLDEGVEDPVDVIDTLIRAGTLHEPKPGYIGFTHPEEYGLVPMGTPEPVTAKPEAPSVSQEERAPAPVAEPRRAALEPTPISEKVDVTVTPPTSVTLETLAQKYPATAEYVADYLSKNLRPDEPFLAWSVSRKFGISELEAKNLIREVRAQPRRVEPSPPKPIQKEIDQAVFTCKTCGESFLIVHVEPTGEHKLRPVRHVEGEA